MIDLHCHILPGVDDGPRTLAESLAMARLAAADGVTAIAATPHLPPGAFAEHAWIGEGVAALNAALQAEQIPLTIFPGAEIMAVPEVLEHKDRLPHLGAGPYLLLEVPLVGLPNYLEELVFALQLAGLRPVLAHPERSHLARHDLPLILRLAERGCILQINADSLLGRNGRAIRGLATRLVREVPACILASDAHDAIYRPPTLARARRAFRGPQAETRFREVVSDRPEKILGVS
jgi:protein-tyrosine phosphatase